MYFKRPSFRRGGSTGIGQLTSNRQMYAGGGNIGGGTIAGSNLGTRTGFESIILQSSGLPYPDSPKSKYVNPFKIKGYPSSKGILEALKPTGLAKYPLSTGVASTAAISAIPAYLAYMNRPRTLEEKKVMQDYGPIDETFFQYDEYDADRKRARGVGEEISFTEALFKDPDTGLYPKIFGDTESRTKRAEIEKAKQEVEDSINMDMRGDPAQFSGEDELTDFDAIAEQIIPAKKTDTDDDTPKEPSFEDTYEKEKSKLEKLLGDDDDKGMAAIALSEAIGTPGTIADKAAVLNKSLLGIMVGKKKDKKDIAKLAYTATKEIEKAKIAAGKEGFSEKQFNRMRELKRIIGDTTGTYNEEQKKAAQGELDITTEVIKTIGGKKDQGLSAVDSKLLENLDTLATKLSRIKDKDSDSYRKAYNQYLRARQVVLKNPNLRDIVALADAQVTGALQMENGGRVKKQLGGGTETTAMEVSETVGQGETPTAQVQQLSFSELRNRLPKEITDDVIRLLSNSNEALQDFAYIRTQGDVSKFNTKYGVTLVLPAQTA